MSLSNLSDLKTNIAAFITDDDLTSYLDTFIALAEARIVRDIKTSELELTTTMTVDSSSEALPSDFAGLVRIKLNGTNPPLEYIPSDSFHSRYASNQTSRPIAYTIEANNILFAPAPDDSYTATYTYIQKPDLVTDNTNRLMTIYPDIYLFGSLSAAANFTHDNEAMAKYEQLYQMAVDQINSSDQFKGQLSQRLEDVP